METKDKVQSPEGALVEVYQELYDTAIANGALVITVHKIDKQFIGNVWERAGDSHTKLIPERTDEIEESTSTDPLPFLQGEMNRYAFENQGKNGDFRFELVIQGIWAKIKKLQDEA